MRRVHMSNVISLDKKLPIEKRVEIDMRSMNYDPNDPDDVNEFWEDRLDGDENMEEIVTYGGKKFKVVITPLDEDEDEE